jgi:hypothetical protein
MKTTWWIRPYTFFSLLAVLFVYLLFCTFTGSVRSAGKWFFGFGLLVVIAAGLLTHYYFIILLLSGGLFILWQLANKRRGLRQAFSLALVFGLAASTFLLLHPAFSGSVGVYLQGKIWSVTGWEGVGIRFRNAAKTLVLLYSPWVAGLGVVLVDRLLPRRERVQGRAADLVNYLLQQPFFVWSLFFSLLPVIVMLFLYLLGVSQIHTFSSRYLGFLVPVTVFVPVYLLFYASQQRVSIPLYLISIAMLGIFAVLPGFANLEEGHINQAELQQAPAVVVDSIGWGTWPAILQKLDEDQAVFIAGQAYLAQHPDTWLPRLGETGGVYISFLRGDENTQVGRQRLLELITTRYSVEADGEVRKPDDWSVKIFRVGP